MAPPTGTKFRKTGMLSGQLWGIQTALREYANYSFPGRFDVSPV